MVRFSNRQFWRWLLNWRRLVSWSLVAVASVILYVTFMDYHQLSVVLNLEEHFVAQLATDSGFYDTLDPKYALGTGEEIHIAVAVDSDSMAGLSSLIHSTVVSTRVPVRFHIFTEGDVGAIEEGLRCSGVLPRIAILGGYEVHGTTHPRRRAALEIRHFNGSQVPRIQVPVRPELAKAGNYVRFHLHRLLSNTINDLVYLDSDTLVLQDLREFLRASTISDKQVAAAVTMNMAFDHSGLDVAEVTKLMRRRRHIEFDNSAREFNAGVMRLNLKRWRELELDADATFWIGEQNRQGGERLWRKFGSQIVMQLVAFNRIRILHDSKWNLFPDALHQLLRESHTKPIGLYSFGILHATGHVKPWDPAWWPTMVRLSLLLEHTSALPVFDLFFRYHLPPLATIRRCFFRNRIHGST